MYALTRRRRVLDIWPGFVDGLAALLMVVIFVLLLFSVGEFMLTDALVGRDEALDRLRQNITELADVLAVERSEKTRLQERLTQMSSDLRETSQARDTARTQLQRMTAQAQAAEAETRRVRDALLVARSALANSEESLRAERDKIAGLETDVATLRTSGEELAAEKQRLQVSLAASQQETAEQTELGKQAQAQLNELNLQIVALREQLAQVTQALDASEAQVREQVVEIENLGQRLNVALANKVEELNRYRSEFFGKLREALKDNPDIHVEGDRFVLPSEVLFASASADLDAGGRRQVQTVAQTLKEISAGIPDDIENDWRLFKSNS